MKNKIIALSLIILAAFSVGFSSPKSIVLKSKPNQVYSPSLESQQHFEVLHSIQEEPRAYTSLQENIHMPITKINEHMKSEAQILKRIASEKEVIEQRELFLKDKSLNEDEIDGYNEDIFESNLVITTLQWALEGSSDDLSKVSDQIYQTIQDKVNELEVGQSISFVGDEQIVDTYKVKHLAHVASENEEDYFYELPFGSITNRHGEILEYKIVGITKNPKKDTGFNLHLHNQEHSVEDYNMCKSDIDVSLEIMSDITDMV